MAGKPSKASEKGKQYLAKNPKATMEMIAKYAGLSVSAVQKSEWWKNRNKENNNV
jgi:hypothetical protein